MVHFFRDKKQRLIPLVLQKSAIFFELRADYGFQNVKEAATWLGYTYLYIRMLESPENYGIIYDELKNDPHLHQRRLDLVDSAAILLEKAGLIKYNRKQGIFHSTDLGKVASYYHLNYESAQMYNDDLKPTMQDIDILRLFSRSSEFSQLICREEEKLELEKLVNRVPIPIRESFEEPVAKVNVLLQAYISNDRLEGLAFLADMVYISQSAARIMRALYEISLKKGWASLSGKLLNWCKFVENRLWLNHSPLRQLRHANKQMCQKFESRDEDWSFYVDMTKQKLTEMVQQMLGKGPSREIQRLSEKGRKLYGERGRQGEGQED